MRAVGFGGVFAAVLLTVIPGRRSVVKAQSLAALPTCAQPAILAAVQASGCTISDKKCFCSNPALIPSLTSAVQEACSEADRGELRMPSSNKPFTNLTSHHQRPSQPSPQPTAAPKREAHSPPLPPPLPTPLLQPQRAPPRLFHLLRHLSQTLFQSLARQSRLLPVI